MTLTVNGTTYTVALGATIHRKIDDLASVSIVTYQATSGLFAPYDVAHLSDGSDWIIGQVDEQLVRMQTGAYQITLTLLEPTKWLEKIILPTQAFTKTTDTLADVVDKALQNAYLSTDKQAIFTLASSARTVLAGYAARDYYFTVPNLREVLDGVLDDIHYRCCVEAITDNPWTDGITIGIKSKMPVPVANDPFAGLTSEQAMQSMEMLNGNLEIEATHALSDEDKTIIHGWDVLKTRDDVPLTSDNAGMLLEYPIEYITKFEALLPAYPFAVVDGHPQYGEPTSVAVDLSDWLVPKEVWDTLETGEGVGQKGMMMYYDRGSDGVALNRQMSNLFFLFPSRTLSRVLSYVYENSAAIFPPGYSGTKIEGTAVTSLKPGWENFIWRVHYAPYLDVHTSIARTHQSDKMLQAVSCATDAVSERVTDIELAGEVAEAKADANGNRMRVVSHTVVGDTVPNDIGATYNGETVVDETVSIYDGFTKVCATLAKDYVAIPFYRGINRERRIYAISLDSLPASMIYKSYLFASTAPIAGDNTTVFSKRAWQALMDGFDTQPYDAATIQNSSIPRAAIFTGNSAEGRYYLSLIHYQAGKNIVFGFKCLDNYSAAYGVGKRILGGRDVAYNPYVNTDTGDQDTFTVQLTKAGTPTDIASLRALPAVGAGYTIAPQDEMSELITLNYYKDRYIAIGATMEIEPRSTSPDDVWWGTEFARSSPLLTDAKRERYLATAPGPLPPGTVKAERYYPVGSPFGSFLAISENTTDYDTTDRVITRTYTVSSREATALSTLGGEMLYKVTMTWEGGSHEYLMTVQLYNALAVGDTVDFADNGTYYVGAYRVREMMPDIKITRNTLHFTGRERIGNDASWGIVDGSGRIVLWCNTGDYVYLAQRDTLRRV